MEKSICEHCSYDISNFPVKVDTIFHACPKCGYKLKEGITVKCSLTESGSGNLVERIKLQD